MKNFIIALLLGGIIGGGVVWYLAGKTQSTESASHFPQTVAEKADSLRTAIDAKLDILGLKADEVKKELAEKGRVVRTHSREWAAGAKDAAGDAAITTKIKGRYAIDKEVSALNISVNTTDGVVTLSGAAPHYEAIAQAMLLALETEGVKQVISTIQVKP